MAQSAYIIKRKKKKFVRITAILISACILTSLVIAHLAINVNPILEIVANDEVKNRSTIIVNKALCSVMGNNISYDDIVSIKKNNDGMIESMSVNTILVSNIAQNTTLLIQSELNKIGQMEISVPLGTLSGITFFGGVGPNITVRCIPVGSVNVSFKSVFTAAGINNTLHSIVMNFDTTVNVIIPGLKNRVNVKTEVLVADTVIIGEVPNTYLNSSLLDGMLNLVP